MPPRHSDTKLTPMTYQEVMAVTRELELGDIVTVTHRDRRTSEVFQTDWACVCNVHLTGRAIVRYEGELSGEGEVSLPMLGATGRYLRVVRGRVAAPYREALLRRDPPGPILPLSSAVFSTHPRLPSFEDGASAEPAEPEAEEAEDDDSAVSSEYEAAQGPTSSEMLPVSSKKRYNRNYRHFANYRTKKKWTGPVTASEVVHYFRAHAILEVEQIPDKKTKNRKNSKWMYSTCWGKHSGIQRVVATLQEPYAVAVVHTFLKHIEDIQLSMGVVPTKSMIFSKPDIFGFLQKDYSQVDVEGNAKFSHLWWLIRQAYAAVGFFSGCRGGEMDGMKEGGVTYDAQYGYWISFTQAKARGATKAAPTRRLLVPFGIAFECLKKYLDTLAKNRLHTNPPDATEDWRGMSLWRSVAQAKNKVSTIYCKNTPAGRNNTAQFAKQIALELGLATPDLFTGHCWRRSSATWVAQQGATNQQAMKWFGWTSIKTAEGYVDVTKEFLAKKADFINEPRRNAPPEAETPPKKRRVESLCLSPARSPSEAMERRGVVFGDVGAGAVVTIHNGAAAMPPPPVLPMLPMLPMPPMPPPPHLSPMTAADHSQTYHSEAHRNVNPYTGVQLLTFVPQELYPLPPREPTDDAQQTA